MLGSLLWATPSTGQEQEGGAVQAPQTTASVSFVDERPLAVKLDKLDQRQKLSVLVHNDLECDQAVRLQLVGLDEYDDKGIRELFVNNQASQPEVGAGESAALTFDLVAEREVEPAAGTYEAVLVASGERGGLARRSLTITVEPEKDNEEGEADFLDPKRPIEITSASVNYVPSLLANLTSLGFFLAFALALALAFFYRPLRRVGRGLTIGLGLLAALSAALALGTLVSGGGIWDQPSVSAISSRPIPVGPEVPDGTRGTASSSDGRLAQLVVAKQELRPRGLDSAATYVGTYNLTPDDGEGEAKATIQVRDLWLYALLTIWLGLYIGFRLHLWLQAQRPNAKVRIRLREIIERYAKENERYDEQDADAFYRGLSIDARLDRLEDEIDTLLEDDKRDAASTKIDALETYIDKYFRLRTALESLDNARSKLADAHARNAFGVELDDVDAYQEATRLLKDAGDVLDPNQDASALDARQTKTEAQTEAVRAVTRELDTINRHLSAIQYAMPQANPQQQKELGELTETLKTLGMRTMQEGELDELKKIDDEENTAQRKLLALVHKIKMSKGEAFQPEPVEDELWRSASPASLPAAETALGDLLLSDWRTPSTPPAVKVRWRGDRGWRAGTGRVNLGDRVHFSVDISPSGPLGFSSIEIDFGDGEKVSRVLPDGDKPIKVSVSHRYQCTGKAWVVVRSLLDGAELAREAIEIDPQPRAAQLRAQVSESDKIVTRVAFILAVGSGLVALYAVDPSWGDPIDYVAAVVWGGVTGEGVKLAVAIADRVWPGS